MALDKSKLKFYDKPWPTSGAETAAKIAKVYDDYAKTALAGTAIPNFTGSEKSAMETIIRASLAVNNPSPAVFINALSIGIAAYWMLPPVTFTQPAPVGVGLVTVAPIPAILTPVLLAGLVVPQTDPKIPEEILVNAIDAATKTVLVTITIATPPSVVVVPLV
jgi:hypothetical protein